MIGRTVRVIALVLASLGLVVACGSSNRPENLSLDEVKPCQLILAEASDDKNFYFKDVPRVQGFRAVRVWSTIQPPGPNTKCELYVDVADEQMLRVYVPGSSGKTDSPTCETARRFAKAALKTLRARQGD